VCDKKPLAFVAERFNQNVTSIDWILEYSLAGHAHGLKIEALA
jgi:hypothetical protein